MPKGYLLLVLHAHLPYVRHPEYDRFLEERWLFEAVAETYIPLIKFFDKLRDEQTPFRLTLSVSPPLANMLEDPLLRDRCRRHLELTLRLAERECERTKDWKEVNFLAEMYRRLYEENLSVFNDRCNSRILEAFREHERAGRLELITCAGTHGYLPLLNEEPTAVRAQVQTAVQEHERLFGKMPRGMWVPECAYYPGLDEVLAEAGVRYFLVDSHAVEHAEPRPLFGVSAPLYTPSGVAAFARHPATSKLVWSSRIGYPADFNYREYYRDIGYDLDQHYLEPFQYAKGVKTQTGIKYHRITGPTQDKYFYNPEWARETAERHARDFVHRCRDQGAHASSRMPFPAVLVSPYDAELFGHWWFEGPQWIYYVFREMARQEDPVPLTPGEYLKAHPIQQKATPGPSSWGKNGYSEHWVNGKTEWMWRPLHEAAVRMTQAAQRWPQRRPGSLEDRALTQAARELMLAQSSDWPFIITNGTTEEYARRRFNDHINRFHYLLNGLEWGGLEEPKVEALEYMDAIFPEMDYRLFAPAGA
jgi:1,4-alpha-glucan branching enzyme